MWYELIPIYDYLIQQSSNVLWIRCEPFGKHLIHWTCAVFSHIARKMNNVCIFSHDQVTHDITAIDLYASWWKPLRRVWEKGRYELIGRFEFTDHLASDIKIHNVSYPSRLLAKIWSSVCDAGLTLRQHWLNVSCLLGRVKSPSHVSVHISHLW